MSKKLTNIEHYPLVKNKLNLIPYLFAKTKNILPLEQKEKEVKVENMRMLERLVMLGIVDNLWVEHLTNMEHMRLQAGWEVHCGTGFYQHG